MPLTIGVNPISRQREQRILGSPGVQKLAHGAMHIHHLPTIGPLPHQPLGVGSQYQVVSFEGLRVGAQAGGQRTTLQRLGIKNWGRQVENPNPFVSRGLMQSPHPIAELGEARFIERKINAVVHPIAGQNQVRLQTTENPTQALVHVRPRKRPASMPGLRQTRGRLAG
jgi:hypothetical protein